MGELGFRIETLGDPTPRGPGSGVIDVLIYDKQGRHPASPEESAMWARIQTLEELLGRALRSNDLENTLLRRDIARALAGKEAK
jgi:hypothetical protein